MSGLPYFLVTSLYMLLFYSCYWLFLRQNTFFGLNRAYLLTSILLSLVLPFLHLPGGASDALPVGTITLADFTVGVAPAQTDGLTVTQWIWLIYGLGIVSMLIRLGLNLRSVFRLIRSGSSQRQTDFTLVRLRSDSSPSFSFGRYLVLNRTDSLNQPAALLRHEEAHIRQRHTADVLFLELVQVAFWFNPVLWLYKHALQEVHEFLADRAVLKTPQPDYPHQLVAYALNVPAAALITPFVSKSTLKQRIVMLQKPASNHRALLGYALVLPFATLLAMCTQQERDLPQSATAQVTARKAVKVEGEVLTVVENNPEFPGGMKKMGEYLQQNLKYPAAAQKVNAQGRVFVNFIVTKTGEITDVQLLKGIGFGADEEAVRAVARMPRWKPGTQNGQAVNVRYNLPINFQLDEKTADNKSAFSGAKQFLIDGKKVTEAELTEFSPDKIKRMDVDKDKGIISITTK
ncbi:M56 family metallopeptidase [Spirosoma agri]|uniref:M56 family metallopeptidase n=1 Tax=Spirosoma agri TaxID=1987381 RepID=A0A6M0IN10_9BACT|nr:M56 family metallopeptidase [Spirosoma agri]NEU68935.1 M56 family metallopeptidase [Spirosoma agri]